MITAEEALRKSLQREYVINWLKEASEEIEKAIASDKSFIRKDIKKCHDAIIYKLHLAGYKVESFSFTDGTNAVRISWIDFNKAIRTESDKVRGLKKVSDVGHVDYRDEETKQAEKAFLQETADKMRKHYYELIKKYNSKS